MSPRTFLRRFQEASGKTPTRWLLDERLLRVQQMLSCSRQSIEYIAAQTGFGSANSMRHHFRQSFAMSPLMYRKKFTETAK